MLHIEFGKTFQYNIPDCFSFPESKTAIEHAVFLMLSIRTTSEASPDDLIKCIKGSRVLALPQSASKVLELAKNPENGPPEYSVPISADPGLTAQVLKFANSSFFGFRHRITTIQSALTLICVRTIKNFVLWNAVFAMLPDPKIGPFRLKLIFQDALRRGVFCKSFASYFPAADPEEVFVAGLLQDIAIPVLAQHWPKGYENILLDLKENGGHLSQWENEHFGWSHADAGAMLAEEWGFEPQFAQAIRGHIRFDFDRIETEQDLVNSIVRLSSMLPSASRSEWEEGDAFFQAFYKVSQKRFLGEKGVPSPAVLFSEVDTMYEDLLQMTQIPKPNCSLTEFQRQYFESF